MDLSPQADGGERRPRPGEVLPTQGCCTRETEVWHQLQAKPLFPPSASWERESASWNTRSRVWVPGLGEGGQPRRRRGSRACPDPQPCKGTPLLGSRPPQAKGTSLLCQAKWPRWGGPRAPALIRGVSPAPVVGPNPPSHAVRAGPPPSPEQAKTPQSEDGTGCLCVCFPCVGPCCLPSRAPHTERPDGGPGPCQGCCVQPMSTTGQRLWEPHGWLRPSPLETVQTFTAHTDCSHFKSLKVNQSKNSVPQLRWPHVATKCVSSGVSLVSYQRPPERPCSWPGPFSSRLCRLPAV